MADPDPQISGGGGGGGGAGHPDPETSGGGGLQKIFFRPLGPRFGLKIRGARATRAPPLDPPLSKHGLSRRTTEDSLPLHWRRLLPV